MTEPEMAKKRSVRRHTWPDWPAWTSCAGRWKRPAAQRGCRARTSAAAAAPRPGAGRRGPAGGGGPGRARTRGTHSRSGRRVATWRGTAAGPDVLPRVRCSAAGQSWSASRSAAHATPTSLNEGVLTVSAESTAWATQLRMVQAQLLAKIAAAVGDGVVTSLKIVGPVAPSWRKGRYHIAGRGPRDTYG